jgi:hypothetical protein
MDYVTTRISLNDEISSHVILAALRYDPGVLPYMVVWDKRGHAIWEYYVKECDQNMEKLVSSIRSDVTKLLSTT